MKEEHLHKFVLLLVLINLHFYGCCCSSDLHVGYQVNLEIPLVYTEGFLGRAFLIETDNDRPNFLAALSVEALEGKYSCSLDVLLGDVRVWSSGHLSKFYTTEKCVLLLTPDGDMQLKGLKDQVGWRSGTSGQGVKRLLLLRTGNLVLVDAQSQIRWQSFNFPTDVMLWGQRLSLETRLTSFPGNSTFFYSLEIHYDKVALHLNSGKWKYSYWEFKPSGDRNISFIQLGSNGLDIYSGKHWRIARIQPTKPEPLRFLALWNKTGNLGLYYYSLEKGKFEVAFQALNVTCDLPMACKPYGICTFSHGCSCIRFITEDKRQSSGCGKEVTGGFCGGVQTEMVELRGVSSVLRGSDVEANVSREGCARLCVDDCSCAAALHTELMECYLYESVRGVKEVDRDDGGLSYLVKVFKGSGEGHRKGPGLKRWILVVVVVVDGFIILLVVIGIGYYVVQKRRKRKRALHTTDCTN